MGENLEHSHDSHLHGPGCGHPAIRHGDHLDYLQNGKLVHLDGEQPIEHHIDVSQTNPDDCRPLPESFTDGHRHGPGCGHPPVPHGDHIDYLVDGRLHHPHGDHCDDHGPLDVLDNE